MSSNPCNYWITGVETIKRQTRAAYGWLVVGQSVDAGLAFSNIFGYRQSGRTEQPIGKKY